MDRATEVRICGLACGGGDDLVTTHTYNAFGDLSRTTLPNGNVVEYKYDTAVSGTPPPVGRLTELHRRPDATTDFERTLYEYNALTGLRVKEKLQRGAGFTITDVTCPPKAGVVIMSVSGPMRRRRDAQEPVHGGADHPRAAEGREWAEG
jgi:YD repeat-containing protein